MELNTILNCYTEDNNEHGYLILFLFWWFEILIKQYIKQHGVKKPTIADNFLVLKKYRNKLDYLVYEMFFIRDLKPSLSVQSNSIRANYYISIINIHTGMSPNDNHNSTLLATLTFNDFNSVFFILDNDVRTSRSNSSSQFNIWPSDTALKALLFSSSRFSLSLAQMPNGRTVSEVGTYKRPYTACILYS